MKKTIILNAGHSINEPGASIKTTTESQEVIKIRDRLAPLLKQNFDVAIVPDELDLTQSINWVNERYKNLEDGLALSIHLNAGGGEGAEIFYYTNSKTSMERAQVIIDKYCNLTRFRNGGVKPDVSSQDKEVSAWIKEITPWSFLLECCFIDNDQELQRLQKEYDEIAWAIYVAICEVFNIKPVNPKSIDIVEKQINMQVHTDMHPLKIENMKFCGPDTLETKIIREYIGDEFGLSKTDNNLQCTEYAFYRVLCAGHKIEWKRREPGARDGGLWPQSVADKYKILDTPMAGAVMSISREIIPKHGHVAYVEKVNHDQSIFISEANWGTSSDDIGYHWERTIRIEKWRDKYKAKFIDFNTNNLPPTV